MMTMSCLVHVARWVVSICTCSLLSEQISGPLFLLDKILILRRLRMKGQFEKSQISLEHLLRIFSVETRLPLRCSYRNVKSCNRLTIALSFVQLFQRFFALIFDPTLSLCLSSVCSFYLEIIVDRNAAISLQMSRLIQR
jgi:hypothetical protein